MKKFFVVIGIFSMVFLSGCGLKPANNKYAVNLEMWGTFDNSSAYSDIFTEYEKVNSNVPSVNYQKHTIESYKDDLLNALAAGNGPDIFMIQSSWLPDFQDKIVPMPEYIVTEAEFRNNFVDVVENDMIIDGLIYGVPLSVDSLGLYYNKDIFNAAGITQPPKTWEEFDDIVKKLTDIDEFGNFAQSAAAMGTAFNINRSADILTVLMLQNGVEMSRENDGAVTFGEPVQGISGMPSEKALEYYTSFASAASPLYTWNKRQKFSIDEFFQGETAMTINYSYHYDTIKAKNAKLNFAVAELPQTSRDMAGGQVNYANYWVLVVAKNKVPVQSSESMQVTNDMRIHEAWQLLKALTFPTSDGVTIANAISGEALVYMTEFDLTEKYLENTGKPAARVDLVEKQLSDVRLGAFAQGNLIARSWRRHNPEAIEAIFADMIDNVNTGNMSVHDAISLGAHRAQNLQPRYENL